MCTRSVRQKSANKSHTGISGDCLLSVCEFNRSFGANIAINIKLLGALPCRFAKPEQALPPSRWLLPLFSKRHG